MSEIGTPKVFYDSDGLELLRRYDVGALLGDTVGTDWDVQFLDLVAEQGKQSLRDLHHETCVDLGAGWPKLFQLTMVPGSLVAERIPGIARLYGRDFVTMMHASMTDTQIVRMTTYDEMTDSIELYEQKPGTMGEVSHSMEPHRDGRFSALLTIRVPSIGGELEIIDQNGVYQVIQHREATFVCLPRGRELIHFTREFHNPADRRIVMPVNYPDIQETPEQRASLNKFNHNVIE